MAKPSSTEPGRAHAGAPGPADLIEGSAAAEAWQRMFELFLATKGERVALMAELGLAPMQAMLLTRLTPDAPQPMSALAGALRCDNSSVTHLVDRLEAAGHVERRPAEHDRRVRAIALTEQGAELAEEVRRRTHRPPAALAALSEADALALRDVLRKVELDGA